VYAGVVICVCLFPKENTAIQSLGLITEPLKLLRGFIKLNINWDEALKITELFDKVKRQ